MNSTRMADHLSEPTSLEGFALLSGVCRFRLKVRVLEITEETLGPFLPPPHHLQPGRPRHADLCPANSRRPSWPASQATSSPSLMPGWECRSLLPKLP